MMDNVGKWHPMVAEAEALKKFGETEIQRDKAQRQRKVTVIICGLFFAGAVSIYEIIRRAM